MVIFGLLADCAPVCGMRCKHYMALGRVLWLLAYLRLAASATRARPPRAMLGGRPRAAGDTTVRAPVSCENFSKSISSLSLV
jgi:hypothetical protein